MVERELERISHVVAIAATGAERADEADLDGLLLATVAPRSPPRLLQPRSRKQNVSWNPSK